MKFIKSNILTILLIGFSIWYLFDEFETYEQRIMFVAIMVILGFGMILVNHICLSIFFRELGFRYVISSNKFGMLTLAIAAIISFFLAGLRLTAILVLGLLFYAILITVIFWIWFRVLKKKL